MEKNYPEKNPYLNLASSLMEFLTEVEQHGRLYVKEKFNDDDSVPFRLNWLADRMVDIVNEYAGNVDLYPSDEVLYISAEINRLLEIITEEEVSELTENAKCQYDYCLENGASILVEDFCRAGVYIFDGLERDNKQEEVNDDVDDYLPW